MANTKNFILLFSSDFILRYGYQIGKMPLLPYFAITLGASEILVGTILSISTITGMFLKPLVGFLSDNLGRKIWLLVASIFFTIFPFLYLFISTPGELTVVRLFHGTATAILGPVSLALVADLSPNSPSTRMGTFGMARSGAYLCAPVSAGIIVGYFSIEIAFYLIGIISAIGTVPLLFLSSDYGKLENSHITRSGCIKKFRMALLSSFKIGLFNKTVWQAGLLEFLIHLVTYSVKVFLPLQILISDTGSFLKAGAYLTIQELCHFLMRPIGGTLGDAFGNKKIILSGLILMIMSLLNLSVSERYELIFISAALFGIGQAFSLPTSLSLIITGKNNGDYGVKMGMVGAIRNSGKVIGPIFSGFLLLFISYKMLFFLLAVICASYVAFQVFKNNIVSL